MGDTHVTDVVELDLRGQVCPATLLKALQALNRLKDPLKSRDAVLVIVTDHRDATATIPDAASSMGYDVAVSKEESHYRITVCAPAGRTAEGAAR
jgi:TusA-related sulfurtransferase